MNLRYAALTRAKRAMMFAREKPKKNRRDNNLEREFMIDVYPTCPYNRLTSMEEP
jgi:hypothetical protein